jgi:hypothetical protein
MYDWCTVLVPTLLKGGDDTRSLLAVYHSGSRTVGHGETPYLIKGEARMFDMGGDLLRMGLTFDSYTAGPRADVKPSRDLTGAFHNRYGCPSETCGPARRHIVG